MRRHHQIADRLIAELLSYLPDGKEIIARENEISARRNEEGFQAYFNCHTDITIPYDEIEEILVIDKDENMFPILRDGRFILEGTEDLNMPLNIH